MTKVSKKSQTKQSCKTGVNGSADFVAVSLFDGMSCLQLALNKIGKIPTKYFASEVDKYAMQVTMANFPNTMQIGDVRNVKGSDIGFVHLLAGGSPCQSFSFAGKRKGMSTKDNIEILTLDHYLELKNQNFEFEGQSYLFWEYMRILEELRVVNPNIKFLLENVVIGEKWQKILTRAIGINPIQINSALVCAQNRNRLYWTNIAAEPDGLFGDLVCKIPQPKDKGILLKDILETDVADKYFLSGKMLDYLNSRKANYNNGKINYKTENDIASCINASSGAIDILDNIIIDTNRKARCFTAGGNSGGLHSQMDLIQCVAMRGRNHENPKSRVAGLPTEQQLEPRNDGKTNCLTSVQKDNLVMLNDNQKKKFDHNPNTDKAGCLTLAQGRAGSSDEYMDSVSKIAKIQGSIRRLAPIECERLQTVPDNYTNHVSDTQRYKMLGNGWTIDVIAHILSYLT
jgi:DNA (cytosine-5)-methyltransferase 3A